MSAERARDQMGRGPADGRVHYDEDGFDDPRETADPQTRPDESKTSVTEWIGQNKTLVALLSSIILIFGAVALYFGAQFAPAIASNPWTHRILAAVTLIFLGVWMASSRWQTVLRNHRWIVLNYPGGAEVWFARDGPTDGVYVPIKGVSLFGSPGDDYSIAAFGDQYLPHARRKGRDADAPMRLKLRSSTASSTRTWVGVVTVQNCDGLSPTPNAEAFDARALPPKQGHASEMEEMSDHVRMLEETIQDKNAEIDRKRERIDALEAEVAEYEEKAREDILDTIERAGAAFDGRTRSTSDTRSSDDSRPARFPELSTNGGGED